MNTQQFATELERATRAMNENRWSDAIMDLEIVHERMPDYIEAAGKLRLHFRAMVGTDTQLIYWKSCTVDNRQNQSGHI